MKTTIICLLSLIVVFAIGCLIYVDFTRSTMLEGYGHTVAGGHGVAGGHHGHTVAGGHGHSVAGGGHHGHTVAGGHHMHSGSHWLGGHSVVGNTSSSWTNGWYIWPFWYSFWYPDEDYYYCSDGYCQYPYVW
jgi:hypothetical protein